MRYAKQMVVLNQHVHDLQEKAQIYIRIKTNAKPEAISGIDAELNRLQDEIGTTISAIGVLGEVR